ncbi:hypothetical protein PS691_04156 [Pseudomonas fluorescens]|uniref:Uncharacterized protein n=1 Tax=Pseudomonas fluorescens TaxID=294 RepID=A0A5E7E1L1_PSEFL|nr:hypothetical protein PS691_04156 [Pseudomonas fluorescens]
MIAECHTRRESLNSNDSAAWNYSMEGYCSSGTVGKSWLARKRHTIRPALLPGTQEVGNDQQIAERGTSSDFLHP